MTDKQLYFHVGMPKTGTTSIQQYFADNAEALLQFHGLYYCYGYLPNTNHCWGLTSSIQKGKAFLRGKCRDAAQKSYRSILISDESAIRCGAEAIMYATSVFQDIFPRHKIKIILYLRRADDWCKSSYGQRLKFARGDNHNPVIVGSSSTFAAYCNFSSVFVHTAAYCDKHIRTFGFLNEFQIEADAEIKKGYMKGYSYEYQQ